MSTRMTATLGAAALLVGMATAASGHGLVQDPPSRNWFCGAITKPDHVQNPTYPVCHEAFTAPGVQFTDGYSFMSVLTHTEGRAVVGPRPHVCGFASETWNGRATVWDQPIDWPTNNISAGPRDFTWNISWGPHFSDTADFRYWITRPEFQYQVGQPLTFADFEDQPFCNLSYDDANPTGNPNVVADPGAATFRTRCTVPQRTGRHVIYAEWGRNHFTFERFHGCIDVAFQGGGPAVDARIAMDPDVSEFTGDGVITLDGRGSQGSSLGYQWSVSSQNPGLYTIDNATQPLALLTLSNPQAAGNVTVSLVVTSGTSSDSATRTFVHFPVAASEWFDLGPVTSEPRAFNVGARVSVRTVSGTGQDAFWPPSPLVITAATAAPEAWPLALAQAVNAIGGPVRIGVLNAQDQVVPVASATANRVFAFASEDIVSAFLQIDPGSVPPAPAGLTASAGNGQVQLAWNAAAGATGYNVKRSTTNGGPYANVATGVAGTSFTNVGLANGTTYHYVVTAVNASGESPLSNQASATPQGAGGGLTTTLVTTTDWGAGYCANLVVTNGSAQPVTWNVTVTIQGTIYTSWNAVFTGTSGQVGASGVGWNSVLQPGQSTQSVGFCANR